MDSVMSETNFELYLLEEVDFVCITLALFFLRGQALDWLLTPLSLQAKARIIKNRPIVPVGSEVKLTLVHTLTEIPERAIKIHKRLPNTYFTL